MHLTYPLQAVVERYGSFGSLLSAPENHLREVLTESEANDEDAWKLVSALDHLRKHTGTVLLNTPWAGTVLLNTPWAGTVLLNTPWAGTVLLNTPWEYMIGVLDQYLTD